MAYAGLGAKDSSTSTPSVYYGASVASYTGVLGTPGGGLENGTNPFYGVSGTNFLPSRLSAQMFGGTTGAVDSVQVSTAFFQSLRTFYLITRPYFFAFQSSPHRGQLWPLGAGVKGAAQTWPF